MPTENDDLMNLLGDDDADNEVESEEDDTQEDETEEESTEESGEDDDQDPEDQDDKGKKANPKAEKRIASLTAQLKAAKEENVDLRSEIDFLEKDAEKQQVRYAAQFPESQLLKYDGKTLAELSEADYHKALRGIRRLEDRTAEEKEALLDMAMEQREKGLPVQKAQADVEAKRAKNWNQEWGAVSAALTNADLMGDKMAKLFKANEAQLRDAIQEDLDSKQFLRKQLLAADTEGKFEYTIKVAKRLGLLNKAQSTTYSENRPDLKVPVGTGKGTKTPVSSGGKRIWSEAEIEKMSLSDYKKNEKAIDKALAEGRVRS